MIVKYSDDHRDDLAALIKLQQDPAMPGPARDKARRAILALKAGLAHEARVTAALDNLLGEKPDWWVFHDLRLVFAGWSAQFDHLLVNRHFEVFICESKHVAEGLAMNAYREFSSFVKGTPLGIPSPLAQNERHRLLLERLLTHQYGRPWFCPVKWNNWVLLPNSARISLSTALPPACQILKLRQLEERLARTPVQLSLWPTWRHMPLCLAQRCLAPFIQNLLYLHTPAHSPESSLPALVGSVAAQSNSD